MSILSFPGQQPESRTNSVDLVSASELLTFDQVMAMLHIGRTKLYALVREGGLRSFKVGRTRLFRRVEIERFIHAVERAGLPKRKRRRKAA